MEGLTAKVFRTFHATQEYIAGIKRFSKEIRDDDVRAIKLVHLRANLEVAKLLNHVTLTSGNNKAKKGLTSQEKKLRDLKAHFNSVKNKKFSRNSEYSSFIIC